MADIRRVALIGGGSASVAVAKHLLAEKHFHEIHIFEQRSALGGVWDYQVTDKPGIHGPQFSPVPHTDPWDTKLETPLHRDNEGRLAYLSPLYDRLEANLPKMLMQHSDLDFPKQDQLFPTHQNITAYLEAYASEEVRNIITDEAQVISAIPSRVNNRTSWTLTVKDLGHNRTLTAEYDAVVIGSGHYMNPFIPSVDGLAAFNEAHPRVVTHSKFFKNPEEFTNKRVLSIGFGPSGQDIAAQIATKTPHLSISTRSPIDPSLLPKGATHLPGLRSFDAATREVEFSDSSRHTFDIILFCTGYLYSYPFLPLSLTSPAHSDTALLRTNGQRVHGVYKHLFYTHDPTLAFLGLPWNIVPFPVAEGQGAVLARVWAGRLALPSKEDMLAWEHTYEEEHGNLKAFHKLPPPRDVEYINELHSWALRAEQREGLAGKEPPFWDDRMRWMRINAKKMRARFFALGDRRMEVRTLEELGFVYPGDEKGL